MDLFIFGMICVTLGGIFGFVIGTIRGWKQNDDLYARMTYNKK